MPRLIRLMPASRNPSSLPSSTEVEFASSVISGSASAGKAARAAAIIAAAEAGDIRLGVPPPKNRLASGRVPSRARSKASSASIASRQRPSSMRSHTCALKSQ
jgi:hypothetical protein